MAQAVRDLVVEIIARQAVLDVADISDRSTPDSLGLDSLSLVESLFAIEEAFDIHVPFNANEPDEGAFDLSNVGSIVREVENLVAGQAARTPSG
ncbi:MAG: acyl carrier protein [Paracoccaceae bacterium]